MAYPKRITIDAARTVAFGGIGAAYAAVGGAVATAARIVILNNLTDQTLWISADGVNDQFILPAGGFKLIDVSANRTTVENYFIPEGTVFYVRHAGVAPTSGSVYVEILR